jgi:hypothetical protein
MGVSPSLPYDRIVDEYTKDRSIRAIAADFGCHYTAVHKILEKTGTPRRRRGNRPGDNGWGGRSRAEVIAAAQKRRQSVGA